MWMVIPEEAITAMITILVPVLCDIVAGALPSRILRYKGIILSFFNALYMYGLDDSDKKESK